MPITAITNITSGAGIPTANAVRLRKEALDVIEQDLCHAEVCMPDVYGQQEGRIVKAYRPDNFSAAATTVDTEGAEKAALTYTEREVAFVLGQYADWVPVSGMTMDTSPTPVLANAKDRLSYRAKLRFDNLQKAVFDSEYTNMSITPLAGANGTLVVNDFRNARTQMRANSVKPQKKFGNRFKAHVHPVVVYDVLRDPAAGGLLDLVKYNQNVNNTALMTYNMDNDIADVAGCTITECTNVTVTVSGGYNFYRSYIHGEGGFMSSTLRGKNTQTPETARFSCYSQATGIDGWNPTGEMGGFASYRAYWTSGCVAGNATIGDVPRSRAIDARSSIS
ncbi:MAG: hypothetical protein E6Q97_31900 [Desulfurellales bacterium]|nr:MAG: hypothetical protein E6Q97_31900 [Desulfurellales bacterium]